MSITLFKMMFKKNWAILFSLTAFIIMELLICVFMFEDITKMGTVMGISGTEILSFTSSVLVLIGVMFPTVFFVSMVFRIVYKPIDSTSLSSHLAAGMKRTTYIKTAIAFIVSALLIVFFVTYVLCGLSMLYWGRINWGIWLYVVFSVFMPNIAVSAISLFFASRFAPGALSKFGMIGIPAILFLFTMISSYVEAFRWASVFMWIEITSEAVAARNFDLWWMWNLIYLVIAVVFNTLSCISFKNRQLAI